MVNKTLEMEEEENLVDWTDNFLKERMKSHGFNLQMTDHPQKDEQGTTPVSGTITFLKGESAKKAKEHFRKKKD